jgi:hypothetical protein
MLRTLAWCCALVLLTPRMAAAEWHITPMIGLTFAGNTSLVDLEGGAKKVHKQFGGAVTLLGGGLLGVESVFVYTPGFFKTDPSGLVTDNRNFALLGNVVLTAPRRWTEYGLRPFVSGGLGLMRVSVTDTAGAFPVAKSLAGFNIGGGAIGFLSQRIGLRFDLRYYANLHRTEEMSSQGAIALGRVHLRYFTGSVGIVFRMRAAPVPAI